MQAIERGMAVPGYVVASCAVLRLPEVLRVNLGRCADWVSACCLMLPFIRSGMTEAYADNPKVYGCWQPRLLATHEAASAVSQLPARPRHERNLGNFKLRTSGASEALDLTWSRVRIDVNEQPLPWRGAQPSQGG